MSIDMTLRPSEADEVYLGDGLYARFDGYNVWLYTPQGDKVAVNLDNWEAFLEYATPRLTR